MQIENQDAFQAQMLEVVQKVSRLRAKEHDLNELVEKFRKRFPPEFHGIEDPADADEWVVQIEKIMKCSSTQADRKSSWLLICSMGPRRDGGRL